MQQVGKLERFQSVEKALIYRTKKLQGGIGGYTPVSQEFEADGVFEVRGLSRQQQEPSRRALVNLSVRPDRRANNRILRVRDSTHPRLYLRKGPLYPK